MTIRNESPGREQRSGQGVNGLIDNPKLSIPLRLSNVNSDLWEIIARAQAELGLSISQPISDGRLHRCQVEGGRRGSKDGAYRICLDWPANLWAMNFKTGGKKIFPLGGPSVKWSPAERRVWAAKVEEDRKARAADQRRVWADASKKAERIYANARPCTGHPYLTAKGIKPFQGLKVLGSSKPGMPRLLLAAS